MTGQVRIVVVLMLLLGVIFSPSIARAKSTAPPGNSGIDEYVEAIPDADGDRPASGGGGAGGGGGTGSGSTGGGSGGGLSPAARKALESRGADGRATASALAQLPGGSDQSGNAAPSGGRKGDGQPSGSTGAGKQYEADSSGSPISAIVRAATGSSDGMGIALPLLLLLALVAAAGFRIRRHISEGA